MIKCQSTIMLNWLYAIYIAALLSQYSSIDLLDLKPKFFSKCLIHNHSYILHAPCLWILPKPCNYFPLFASPSYKISTTKSEVIDHDTYTSFEIPHTTNIHYKFTSLMFWIWTKATHPKIRSFKFGKLNTEQRSLYAYYV